MSDKSVTQAVPNARMKYGWELRLNKAALEPLGNPEYIRFLWSAERKILLLGAARADTPQSLRISAINYQRPGSISFRNHSFTDAILKLTGWTREHIYRTDGVFVPKLGMVAFEINKSVEEVTEDE